MTFAHLVGEEVTWQVVQGEYPLCLVLILSGTSIAAKAAYRTSIAASLLISVVAFLCIAGLIFTFVR